MTCLLAPDWILLEAGLWDAWLLACEKKTQERSKFHLEHCAIVGPTG
jgi:hypothetical protein